MHDCFNVDTDVVTSLLLLVFLVFLDAEHPSLITRSKRLFAEKILSLISGICGMSTSPVDDNPPMLSISGIRDCLSNVTSN